MATVAKRRRRSAPEHLHPKPRVRWASSLIFLATYSFLSVWQRAGVRRTMGMSLGSTAVAALGISLSTADVTATTVEVGSTDEPAFVCPRCEDLFSRLEGKSTINSRRNQEVRITLRGEPKTGTGIMSSWAVGALARTCELLRGAFGTASCRFEPLETHTRARRGVKAGPNHEWTMTFEPQLSVGAETCSCETVGRVRVVYSDKAKHKLPVSGSCPWSHVFGIPSYSEGCKTLRSGEPVTNYDDLRTCMQESPCDVIDRSFQFATTRDPRAVAVSTYFWIETHAADVAVYAEERVNLGRTLDESILEILESVCLWTSTRHILFNDFHRVNSTVFGYEEARNDVLEWHYRWTHLAGLNLPVAWVKDIASLARGGNWASLTHGVNPHPGGEAASAERTWRDEVSPGLWDDMDAVVRRWLPCDQVESLGMSCTGTDVSVEVP